MKKAIILSRVSTLHQDLTQQTDAVLKEVRKDGYSDDNVIIIEDKESAIKLSEEERMGLNKMKECINSDPNIDTVYLYELSRLSRRSLVLFSVRDFLIERKIQLICLKPYFKLLDYDGSVSQSGSLMFSLFSTISEQEMVLKKERMLRGRMRNKLIGKTIGGRPTFGYITDKNKYYVVEPKQAELLKRIYNEYIGGKPIFAIATELKEEGYFPDCISHTLSHKIDRWLKAEYLLGNSQYPPIISKSLFDRAQKVRAGKKKQPRKSHKNIFLLKGIIFDAQNGKPLWGQTGLTSYSDTHFGGCCIKAKNVEPLVWDIAKKLYRKHIMNKTIYQRQLQKDLVTIGKKIETIQSEIETIKSRMDKVEERLIFGKLSKSRADELLVKLSLQLSEKENRLSQLSNESIGKHQQIFDADVLGELNEATLTLDERIDVVRKVIRKVNVKRCSLRVAHISVFNKINKTVSVYEVQCRTGEWKKIDDNNSDE